MTSKNLKRGKGLYGQPTPENFQLAYDKLMNEIELHENSKKKLELQRELLKERLHAGKKIETRLDLKQRNSDLTQMLNNLLLNRQQTLEASDESGFDQRIQLSLASDKFRTCEFSTQTIGVKTDMNREEGQTFDISSSGIRVKSESQI